MLEIIVKSPVDGHCALKSLSLYICSIQVYSVVIFQLPVFVMSDSNHLLAYDSHSAFKGSSELQCFFQIL